MTTLTRAERGGSVVHDYGWQRYWVSQDGNIDLSDDGFLVDPTIDTTQARAPKLHTLHDLQDFRALALLGEPGIGKTATLAAEYKSLEGQIIGEGIIAIHVDLRSYSSEVLLHRRLFESPEFITWKGGNSHLILHLDSLDEALLRIDSVAALIADELPRFPTARMSVRIACRTAVW
jgi:hypothetical protein